jgi:VanZ family protein
LWFLVCCQQQNFDNIIQSPFWWNSHANNYSIFSNLLWTLSSQKKIRFMSEILCLLPTTKLQKYYSESFWWNSHANNYSIFSNLLWTLSSQKKIRFISEILFVAKNKTPEILFRACPFWWNPHATNYSILVMHFEFFFTHNILLNPPQKRICM